MNQGNQESEISQHIIKKKKHEKHFLVTFTKECYRNSPENVKDAGLWYYILFSKKFLPVTENWVFCVPLMEILKVFPSNIYSWFILIKITPSAHHHKAHTNHHTGPFPKDSLRPPVKLKS